MMWKSIKDDPPPTGVDLLLVYPPDGKTIVEPRYGIGRFGNGLLWDWPWTLQPTYWMRPPPPPCAVTGVHAGIIGLDTRTARPR